MSALSFESLTKYYERAGKRFAALDHVSFSVQEGEFFGLLGPNGAGKTTLISILAGLTAAHAGKAQVLGQTVSTQSLETRRLLGIVPQEIVFDPFFTVRETLRFQAGYFSVAKPDAWIDELLAGLGLTEQADINMRRLSGGMKRRVLVAQALVHKPPVIVLDEPTAGVDVQLRQSLWQFITKLNKAGHTILLTTHYLEEAESLCTRLAMLSQGELIRLATTQELLQSANAQVLSFKTDDALPAIFQERAKIVGRRVQWPVLGTRDIEDSLRTLREAGINVEDVQVEQAALEDVFIQVMNTPKALG